MTCANLRILKCGCIRLLKKPYFVQRWLGTHAQWRKLKANQFFVLNSYPLQIYNSISTYCGNRYRTSKNKLQREENVESLRVSEIKGISGRFGACFKLVPSHNPLKQNFVQRYCALSPVKSNQTASFAESKQTCCTMFNPSEKVDPSGGRYSAATTLPTQATTLILQEHVFFSYYCPIHIIVCPDTNHTYSWTGWTQNYWVIFFKFWIRLSDQSQSSSDQPQ